MILTPFTGTAGAAMNWEWQFPGQEQYWHHMGPVNELMSGIKLDEENWQVGDPQTYEDNMVEMLYLFSEEDGNNQRKAVGAISNRTYNYYTQSPAGSLCKDSLNTAVQYKNDENFISTGVNVELSNMGFLKQYHVEWFNALTGDFLMQQEYSSGIFEHLDLSFPDILTGNETSPILFFTVHPAGGSLKMTEKDSSVSDKIICQNLIADTTVKYIKPTVWDNTLEQNNDLIIHVSPNPASDILNISVESNSIEIYQWYLLSDKGDILISGILGDKNFVVDLSGFESGTYYFALENTLKKKVVTKIIKV
ncbi:MAG: T9SS type A sorting domain-containing protein [Crocinitomicaceae bacterium]|nr:T9SS type A sorting domain-containing protein [Crocinitomicaceae bacterium]